jgi:hypothetical protein
MPKKCDVIENTLTGQFLSYDPQTLVIVWVDNIEEAYCFSNDVDLNIVLSLLNATENIYIGRPGDRGGR